MAELPVESKAAPHPRGSATEVSDLPGAGFVRGMADLPAVRQVALLIALALSVAIGVSVVLWMREPSYQPLTDVLSAQHASEVVTVLESSNVPYRIDQATGMIMVAAEQIHAARMKLAGAEVVTNQQIGFELLEGSQGFGVSQFMETARFRRGLAGELARSIMTINTVEHARVHLAIPKRTTFLRDQRTPKASVTVTLLAGQSLAEGQVRAIMNLVAGAVPELDPGNVTVVDQGGRLLSGQDQPEGAFESTERQLAYTRRVESDLEHKIGNILVPIVGPDRFSAEVTADIDFTWMEQTAERYDRDAPALRSEAVVDEVRVGVTGSGGGVPGVLSNQPPAAATVPETADGDAGTTTAGARAVPRRSRSEATRNYELDRTISHTRAQVGELERLTVSVVVDNMPVPGSSGESAEFEPWPEAELARLTESVKSAIGFDAERGDTVSVINTPFINEPVVPLPEPAFWVQPWFLDLMKQLLGAIVLLALVLGLLRPLFRNLSRPRPAGSLPRMELGMAGSALDREAAMAGTALLPRYGDAAQESKLEAARGLVADNPARVAHVVKHWVNNNE